jgi:predicted small lipoprotein YifL
MKSLIRFVILIVAMMLSLMLLACQEKGPAEKAGEAIDDAVETTKEKAHEAKEKAEEALK